MKKLAVFACFLCVLLLCSACLEQHDSTYEVTLNHRVFTVDSTAHTIECEGQVISYAYSGSSSSGIKYEFTYPDGATYWWVDRDFVGHGGWSEDYDESRHIPGDDLIQVLNPDKNKSKADKKSGNPFIGILLIALGLFNAIAPQKAWYLSYGWRFKNAEPSDAALGWARFGGIVAIVIGVILLIV
ncbi:MAG: hypothetical protein IJP37_03280 [Clostridia bacterium]|nr:hypothetical protein [Clostridia bacterium]MBR0026162.1 hypothetical protein [Clostridia bacterium]